MAPIGIASDIDDLKKKCPGALADTELVNIVQRAPLNNNGKINLSWIDREAEKYLREKLSSSQTIEKLRKETRVLAKFRRDFTEEFEKLIVLQEPPKPTEKKEIIEVIQLGIKHVNGVKTGLPIGMHALEVGLTFRNAEDAMLGTVTLLDRFRRIPEIDTLAQSHGWIPLRDMLVWLLEEKFGLKVKVCGNCNNLSLGVEGSFGNKLGDPPTYFKGACTKLDPEKAKKLSAYGGCNIAFVEGCLDWTPKEIPEKKEN